MKPLVQVEDLVQEFKVNQGFLDSFKWKDKKLVREKKAVHAVNKVSFDIYPGEAFSLVGESGCGKSTTAKNHHPPFEPGLRPHLLWRGRYQPLEIRENAPIQKEDADDISGSLRVA